MTNKELFTQMMKHNTSLPTEQTSFQVLERSRSKGYVRSRVKGTPYGYRKIC